ncbi:4-hydroxythreonine-4-phosphate dehydrogenase PdxA [Roseovarius indicus]|uniref:4-hydroxythreonine-4-phosphate dehydrogenase n=1 Tax=Roseovarius indicus TaxID=540747 RepID=A0A0T5PAC1_9RHOB|nr:4-hydroxythreonine-4-phosphate dehydrogenase PdxA [Roseovarius indicus]KRS17871.1 4-hydroxythreonine-4-phosphate dehydrogenase [Roseovarius indicus]QEW27323.1 4-hydroxythreonine-4-phosphate dehydrogenase [Roseovarius indicus]SFD50334.1 4-hydroxythreonine-4-phosphate dehydrogenase [Roseovarius indicus]
MTAPIALTCGEPAGIGPELAVRAWEKLEGRLPFFLIGDPDHLPEGARVVEIDSPEGCLSALPRGLPVLPHRFEGELTRGTPNPAHAQGVIDVIARAVTLVQDGYAGAVCTSPIHKKALQDGAGFGYPGHTEYLAALGGVERVVMMLASDALRVVPTTIHIPLKDVPEALTADLLRDTLRITHAALVRDFSIPTPRLAVAGLNPHAGEGGKMGREEIELIAPVVEDLRAEGLDLAGPMSADTMFHAGARATYDAAVAMYHDQALIPIKTLDFDRGVNVTLGLPFIRTSPDHGTALDIAGKGVANPSSTIEALRLAARMAVARSAA